MNVSKARVYIDYDIISGLEKSESLTFKQVRSIENMLAKAKVIGAKVRVINDKLVEIHTGNSTMLVSDCEMHLSNSYSHRSNCGAFMYSEFTKIDLTDLHTEYTTDMSYLFMECKASEIIFSEFNTSNVTDMANMFSSIVTSNKLDLSNFNTINVKDMSNMFAYSEIGELDISNFDTSNVENMEGMFRETVTKNLDLSSFNTIACTDMECMFKSSVIDSIKFGNFDIRNVRSMKSMFEDSKFNELNLESMGATICEDCSFMFYKCRSKVINIQNITLTMNCRTDNMFSDWHSKIEANDINIKIELRNSLMEIIKRNKV